jgi:hypothetical protein
MADHHHHDAAELACPSCDFGPFQRNAYWTGKLMLAGDFIAEQHYFMEKLRHHNAHLHGTGAVCGLKVVAHDKDECRSRFICVEPGTAIDCCGHEIVLRFKEYIDLDTIPAVKALKDKNDTAKHQLVICIRFRECETEQVPVLYDDCGCRDDKCAPNRVLEAFELDVLVDPKPPEHPAFPAKCGDLWRTSVAGCPHCDTPDCVVLATITDYVAGNKIIDAPEPPNTVPAGSVPIDNFTDRQILPSAQLIKAVIDCMLNQGPGGTGTQGPPGPGIDDVKATFVPCTQPGTAKIEDIASKRTLVLEVPKGCDGKDGIGTPGKDGAGLEDKLTRIIELSWHHAGSPRPLAIIQRPHEERRGLVVKFSNKVQYKTVIGDHVFQVLIDEHDNETSKRLGLRCRCPLIGEVIPVVVTGESGGIITSAKEVDPPDDTDAVAFLLPKGFPGNLGELPQALRQLLQRENPELLVVLRCDFVLDTGNAAAGVPARAIDGEFVRGQLPTGDRPAGSTFGIQGGTFESWFQIQRQG